MAYYDEVIERNKRYLTNAQVNALVAASQEYNIQNAGNRAGALASAREQYDTGYRGLQNMGLAGAMSGAPTSGEVPRLQTQIQAPFDAYNNRLKQVENQRLNAMGGMMAEQTRQARAAAAAQQAAAKAAQEEAMRQAQLRAAAEIQTMKNDKSSVARVINNNRPSGAKGITSEDLNTIKRYDEPYEAPAKPVTREQTVNSALSEGMKQAVSTPSPQLIAAAQMLGISSPANKVVNKVTNALSPVLNQKGGVAHTDDERDIANNILQATKDNMSKGFDMDQAQKDLEAAQKKVDALASVRGTSARPGVEEAYQQAVQQRDVAKLKVEDPKTYSYMVVANSNADPATKRMVGTKFINEKFTDDANDAAMKYKTAQDTVNRMEAEYNKSKPEGPELSKVNDAIEIYYSAVKAYEDTAGNGAPSAASRAPINKANELLNSLGFKSIHAAERYRDSLKNTEEPEALTQARDNLAAAELRYKDPDTYRALQMMPYKDMLKQTNPDVIKQAEEKVADYQLKSMGIKVPGMNDSAYTAEEENIPGLRKAYNNWKMSQGDAAEWNYEKELKDKYGVTPEEAEKRLNQFDTEKDNRLEYSYYKDGMVALLDHSGETPSRPVNTDETDPIYRKVNGLSNITMAATEYEGAESYNVANWMTQEQKDAYNAIYERDGIEAADQYFKDITPFLNIKRAMQDEAYYRQYADEHPLLADLRSVGASLLYNVPAAIDRLAHGAASLFTDTYYDPNSELSYRSGRADVIRSERSQNILSNMSRPEWVNNVLNFAYQTGMSMADSGVAMTFAYAGAPWMVDALFFSSAGNAAYKEARERGATQAQAMEIGILSGAAEAFFEHASIEHFMKLDYTGKGALVKNLLSQGFVEGSEEVATEIANALTDAWIMRDKSKYAEAVNAYVAQGMTEEQAQNKAFMDQLADIGMAGIGGAVSGGLFALGGAAVSSIRYNQEGKRLSQNAQAKDRIIQLAEIMGGDAQEALDAYNADQTNRNLGELSATVQQNLQDVFGNGEQVPAVSKVDAMKMSPGVGNQMDLDAAVRDQIVDKATAYAALLSGDKMVAATAQTILDVLGAEQLKSMGYDASSAMKLMSSYNKRLDQYGIQSRADALANRTFQPIRGGYQSQLRQTPSAMGAVRAGSALTQTQQRTTEANVVRAENMAVNRVWENPEQGLAQIVNGRTITPMPGNLTAVSIAEQQRTNFKANATATSGRVTYAVAGMQAREGMSNEQTLSEIKKSLTKEARAKADFYEKLSKALGLKLTIHDVMVGTNGFIDENGMMHVVLSGKQSVLRVAAHELTHYMKENAAGHYAEMREYLIADVGQEKFERMIKQKAREYGIDLSTEKGRTIADDEVCAELCERMLSDEESLEKFAEKDTAAAKALKDHLVKILNAIKSAFKRTENRDFGSSWSDLIKNQDTIESWITGLQEAIRNADARAATNEGQIGSVAGVTTVDQNDLIEDIKDAKTDAEVDEAFAEHSVDVIEYDMAGYMQDLTDAGVMTSKEIDDLYDTMNAAINTVKAHRAILDYGTELTTEEEIQEAKRGRAYMPYKQNADPHYKLALDFSTLCRKRVLLQTIQERLQAKLGRALSQEETVAIRLELQKLQREGYKVEVACALCYVEAARLKSPKVVNKFLSNTEAEMRNYFAQKNPASKNIILGMQQQWKVDHGYAPDTTKKQMSSADVAAFNDYSRSIREQFESDHPAEQVTIDRAVKLANGETVQIGGIKFPGRETFLSASWLTKLKSVEPDIFNAFTDKVRSATRSKAQETDTFYSRGDIDMVTESILNYANAESGFRHQSWSDFVPTHLLDTMAAVIEMSTKNAKMHAYTKVPSMVELLGKSGMMLNMSLIPAGDTGLNVDGDLAFDSVEGMPWETMMRLRDMFPNTAGNIAIGISDDQIRQLLDSNDIDYVIPYHASGMNKNMRGYLDIRAWSEYTSSQNEKTNHRGQKGAAPELAEWFDEKAAKEATDGYAFMREASEKYLQLCYERNLIPKFSQYLTNNGDGSYSLKEGYENYWKMLTDRKMVNQVTGKVIIQQTVKPTFDQATVLGILEDRLHDPAIQDAAEAADIVTEKFSGWQANKNNASAEAIQEAKNIRDRTAAITAQKTAESGGVRNSLDTDELRETFTHIDTSALENGLESLKNVTPGKGLWAIKDISRFLDSISGGNKELRDTLTGIFETPHRQALKNYATGVSEMQKKVLEIGAKAGVCDDKGHHFDKKKSAAIQNIGEGFCNKATDVTVRVVDADAVRVTATDKETGKSLGTKDYTFRELRGAYGHEVADQLWSDAFDAAQKEGRHVDVEREVNTQPYTLADLKEAYPQDWQKLKTAADEFRTMYDNYIRDINNMLETIYPYASKYATVDQITEAIEKKQQRLADRKAAYTTQIENLKKSLEEKEKEIASKRKTDTATYRKLVEQRNVLKTRIADTQAEIAEYEANIKDQLTVMGEEKAMMMNAEREGDSLGRMHRLEYRSDYFHHFTEMTSGIQNLKSIFTGNTDISPAVVGKSDTTKPKSRWAGFFQQRKGGDYTADALNGMLRYGQLAEYKMAFDPFAAYLRDVEKQVASLDKNETNRDNLIRYIQQWTNTILGKSHTIDRALVDSGVGMRSKLFKAMSWINSRVIQNTLLWNMRSALIQISNVTNAKGIVTNNLDWANGLRKWALARRGNSEMQAIMNQSTFLASRYMDSLQLTDSVFKSAKEFAGWLLGALDEVSAKATWWAAYTQYQRNPNAKVIQNAYRTYDNAIEYADDVTRRTHAGRGVGELAPAMTSRVINLIAPFQVEVNNTYQLLKDNVKQKNYLGLLSTGLSIFALNTIFEAIVGSTPLGFDFIRAIVDIAFGIAGDDPEDDDDDYDVKRAAQRIAGEFVGGLPYANQIVGLIGKDNAEKIIGSDTDVTRYGNTQIGLNAMMNTIAGISDIGSAVTEGKNLFTETNFISDIDDLLNIIMPMGAKQMTRTAEGLLTMAKGYGGKVDKEGNEKVQFVADNDLVNWLHAGLFGKWSLTQASEYFDEERLLPKLFGAYEGPRSATGKLVDAEEYKAALDTGIDGKQFFSLKYDLKDYTTQGGKRAEMMQQSFTPEQKAKLDALMLGSKDAEMKAEGAVVYQKSGDEWKVKADYTNQDMFDLSQAGDKTYTGTLEAMEKTGLPQDQAVLVSSMWDQAKKADDSKAEFRNMLRDNKNLTVAQKEALDLQYCGNKYAADYSDPELYELSITNRTTYEKAKQAKANGIPVKNYVSLLDKKNDYSGEDKADYMRREIMSSSLTAQQKELLDDLLVSDQGRNPDYSSQAWFDISMLGGGQYQEAKEGEKVGLKPETYLTIYNKWKTLDAKNENGKTVNGLKKKRAKEYLDSLTISAPVYDYIWTVIFGYKK